MKQHEELKDLGLLGVSNSTPNLILDNDEVSAAKQMLQAAADLEAYLSQVQADNLKTAEEAVDILKRNKLLSSEILKLNMPFLTRKSLMRELDVSHINKDLEETPTP